MPYGIISVKLQKELEDTIKCLFLLRLLLCRFYRMRFKMFFDELKTIIEDNNYIEKSKILFWEAMKNYQKEENEEFNKKFKEYDEKEVAIDINDVSFLAHNWPEGDSCCVVININISYQKKLIGYYDVHYNINGDVEDDYFVIY